MIVAVENPIKGKLIEEYFKTEEDILNYKKSILENPLLFEFDYVFNINTEFVKKKKNLFFFNYFKIFYIKKVKIKCIIIFAKKKSKIY